MITIAGITINASQANIDQVQDAYIAYYARAADVGGLKFWAEKLQFEIDNGNNNALDQLVNEFGQSAESTALYGGLNETQLINNVYLQILGRNADNDGLNFYLGLLDPNNANAKSLASIALDIYNGAKNSVPATTDTDLINNKFAVATKFTEHLDLSIEKVAYAGDTNAQIARDMLSNVTNATDAVLFDVDTTIALMVNGQPSTQSFTTTVGDNLTGLGTFSGVVSSTFGATTLNAGDSANASGTGDVLQVILDGASYNGGATLTGFESVELRSTAGSPSFLASDLGISPTQIASKNSTADVTINSIQSLSTKIVVADTNNNVNANWDAALLAGATTVAVELSNANGAGLQTINVGNDIETVALTSHTTVNDIKGIVGGSLSTIQISGDQDIHLHDSPVSNVSANDSDMTGRILFGAIGIGDHNLSGGAANDHFTFNAGELNNLDIIDGNGGSADVLKTSFTANIANPLNISDVEIFSIDSNATVSVDMGNVSGINTVQVNADGNNDAITLNNISTLIPTVSFTGNGVAAAQVFDDLYLNLLPASDTANDSLAVNVNNQGTALAAGQRLDGGGGSLFIAAPDVENFNVSFSDGAGDLRIVQSISLKNVTFSGSTDNDRLEISSISSATAELVTLSGSTSKSLQIRLPEVNKVTTINLDNSSGADTIEFSTNVSANDANSADGYVVIDGFDSSNDRLDVGSFTLNHGTGILEKAAATGATDNNTTVRVISDNGLLAIPAIPNQPTDANTALDALTSLASSTFAASSNFAVGEEALFALDGTDGNTYLFHFENTVGSIISPSDDINLIAVLNGVDTSALSAANFIGI